MEKIGFLGGDVSKGMSNFVLQDYRGEELESNFQLDDTARGHEILEELLGKMKTAHGLTKIVVGVESTGGYENNWYNGLRSRSEKLSLEVFRINPKRIYHEAKTEGRTSISDGVSAGVIAGYLRKNYGKHDLEVKRLKKTDQQGAGMRSLHKYIQRLIGQSTRTKNALEKLLYSAMPELLAMKRDKYHNWFLELLSRFPSRESILSADSQDLVAIPHVTLRRANTICAALENSVGAPHDQCISIAISQQAQDIQHLEKKIKMLKNKLLDLANKEMKQDIEILKSIRGLADDLSVGIIMEIGDIGRFDKANNLVAFWGINPTLKQSGDKNYKVGMSKSGSRAARAIMFLAAKNVVMHSPYFSTIYHKQRNKGKGHYDALGVVMSKLTRVVFGMLKNKKKFDGDVDLQNQMKMKKQNSKEDHKDKTERRYQKKKSTQAPISMVQRRKRKQKQTVLN